MNSKVSLALKYALFAGIATLCNIGTQKLSFLFYTGKYDIYLAMFLGTGVGLAVKFVLDKIFIFNYREKSVVKNLGKFILYSLMGVITTLIFWGVELLFNHLSPFEAAKYIGAAIGLTIGYTTKYFLDKYLVFKNNNRREE